MSTRDSVNVVCPFCGYEHGDAWEWCNSESPQNRDCDECGKTFVCWAEYSVDYIAQVRLTEAQRAVLRGAARNTD